MWAMIPMLRVLASGNSRMVGASAMGLDLSGERVLNGYDMARDWRAQGVFTAMENNIAGDLDSSCCQESVLLACFETRGRARPASGRLPAVVRERLVRLGHLVHIVAALDRGPRGVHGVHELARQTVGHAVLAPLPGVPHQPADGEGGGAPGANLDRY